MQGEERGADRPFANELGARGAADEKGADLKVAATKPVPGKDSREEVETKADEGGGD